MLGKNTELNRDDIKKLLTTAQIFLKSDNRKIQEEASILLSMLLDTCVEDHKDLLIIAKEMFLTQGDFPNIDLLEEKYESIEFSQNFISEAEFDFRESLNTVKELGMTLTDYQRSLWEDLETDQDIITVAPTSAGKTHIILNYLVQRLIGSDGAFAAIVVPTRALISEVAAKVYNLLKGQEQQNNVEICTVPRDKVFLDRTIFVVTQERLYEILQKGDVFFDYLFVDEAHNIADSSRGVLLHLTIEKLLSDSNPQLIISMPSPNYQNAFSSIFLGVDFKRQITSHSPVAKILISVQPKGKNLVISRLDSKYSLTREKKFSGKKLSDIVFRIGNGQSNIIYRNRTDHCENIANEISILVGNIEVSSELEEAADYIENFIHSEFSLANNLRRGVAFHYGPLPSSVRVMVENLAKDDLLKFIACTSTLAEGVNLPAKNLFLKNPIQPVIGSAALRVEDVKINNITGRAGRMLQHFSGNIFLVEPKDWHYQDYFEEKDEEQKIPSFYKSLNDDLGKIFSALNGQFDHNDSDQYRVYTIANKLLKEYSVGNLEEVLRAEDLNLSDANLAELKRLVKGAYENLKVAPFTLEANPTVGYIQQNKIFEFLSQLKSFDDWLLPHPRSRNLFSVLSRVAVKLNEFGVYIPTESYSVDHNCLIARKWIQGVSLKDIISQQIEWDQSNGSSGNVNSSVRNVIKIINNDITFRLSNSLRCYDVLLTNILSDRGIEGSSAKIHSYLEIGGCDERLVSLINMGLSREASKQIDDILQNDVRISSVRDLIGAFNDRKLDNIHAVTKKELIRLFGGV